MPKTLEERRAQTRNATETRIAREKARATDPDVAAEWITSQLDKCPPLTDEHKARIAAVLFAGRA